MRFSSSNSLLLACAASVWTLCTAGVSAKIQPKVLIVSMFSPEAKVWYGIPEFNLLERNITVPGLSPLFPEVHCTANGEICQMVTGEAEINAAASVSAMVLSDEFDLSETYFFIAGIGGINPEVATTGAVTFARYAVQVALQYEFDARSIPSNWSTGYVPQGSLEPGVYPGSIYGTEVFEVNSALRQLAINFARNATLNDTATAQAYRANYAVSPEYAAGAAAPSVVACDVATSDVYYSGHLLSEAFANTTKLLTNGTALYCSTAQEDNATLEVLTRAAKQKLVDFGRIIVMRTASDFDRAYPGSSDIYNLLYAEQGGYAPAIANIYIAGVKVVEGIVGGWNSTFQEGVKAPNYIGDIFGTLGGEPDFGPGSDFEGTDSTSTAKRSLGRRSVRGVRGAVKHRVSA